MSYSFQPTIKALNELDTRTNMDDVFVAENRKYMTTESSSNLNSDAHEKTCHRFSSMTSRYVNDDENDNIKVCTTAKTIKTNCCTSFDKCCANIPNKHHIQNSDHSKPLTERNGNAEFPGNETTIPNANSRVPSQMMHRNVKSNSQVESKKILLPIEIKCYLCQKEFPSAWNLKRHLVTKHFQFGGMFKCSCGDSFLSKEEYGHHLSQHGTNGIPSCRHCKKSFVSVDLLAGHLSSHRAIKVNSKPVQERSKKRKVCKYCDQRFTHYFAWSLHVKTHREAEIFSCKLCSKWFVTLRALSAHVITHLRDKKPQCYVCGRAFRFKQDYLNHQKENCSLTQIRCEKHLCYKSFFTWKEYHEHLDLAHHFRCKQCGKSFQRWEKLQEHHLIHTGEKPHECNTCGKRFRTKYILKNHKTTHFEVKSFHCKSCDKSFTQKTAMLRHEKTHIEGRRDHCCHLCGKSFTQSCSLARHLRIHTGERFKCTKCSATFIEAWRMRVHIKNKHQ